MSYSSCCYSYSDNTDFSFCPECKMLLIRCQSCQNLAPASGLCDKCLNLLGIIKTGRLIKQNHIDIAQLRLQNKGNLPLTLKSISYRPSGQDEYINKTLNHYVLPDQSTDVLLDNIIPKYPGLCALDIKIELQCNHTPLIYSSHINYATVKEDMSNRHIIIKDNKLEGASDIKVNLSESSLSSILGEENNETFERLLFTGNLSYPHDYATRKTTISYPHPETKETVTLNFALSTRLLFGKARPSKDPRVNAMLRVIPDDTELKHIANRKMSRHHFYLELMEGNIYICDISSCGTYLNGKPLTKEKPVKLNHKDRISPLADFNLSHLLTYWILFTKQNNQIMLASLKPIAF